MEIKDIIDIANISGVVRKKPDNFPTTVERFKEIMDEARNPQGQDGDDDDNAGYSKSDR